MVRPSWVLYGTPAGGAGVYGLFEGGVAVVSLCRNMEHEEVLRGALKKRLAADLCRKLSPLHSMDLLLRAEKLKPQNSRTASYVVAGLLSFVSL